MKHKAAVILFHPFLLSCHMLCLSPGIAHLRSELIRSCPSLLALPPQSFATLFLAVPSSFCQVGSPKAVSVVKMKMLLTTIRRKLLQFLNVMLANRSSTIVTERGSGRVTYATKPSVELDLRVTRHACR